jgi:hypothetical protein
MQSSTVTRAMQRIESFCGAADAETPLDERGGGGLWLWNF